MKQFVEALRKLDVAAKEAVEVLEQMDVPEPLTFEIRDGWKITITPPKASAT